MARPKKNESDNGSDRLQWFLGRISSAKADSDDTRLILASVFKEAKGAGLHTGALKLVAKLRAQESLKAAEFLRAFDQYRHDAGLDQQPDLLGFQDAEHIEA